MVFCLIILIIDRIMIDFLIVSFMGLVKYLLLTKGKWYIGKYFRIKGLLIILIWFKFLEGMWS